MNKNQDIKERGWLAAYKWQYQAYPFFTSVYVPASTLKPQNKYNIYWGDFLNNFEDGHLTAFKQSASMLKAGNIIIKETLAGNRNYLKELNLLHIELQAAIQKCQRAKSSKSLKLGSWWRDTEKALSHTANLLFCFDYPFDKFLLNLSRKKPKDFEFISANINEANSFMAEAGDYLLRLAKDNKNKKTILSKFNQKFSWLRNTYAGPLPITEKWLNVYLSDLKKIVRDKEKANILIKPKIDYSNLIKLANKAVVVRDDKKKLLLLAVDLMDSWLKNICRQYHFSYRDLRWLTVEEILALVCGGQAHYLLDAKKYEREKRRLGLMRSPGYIDVPQKFWQTVVSLNQSKKNKSLSGIPASLGVYSGRISVVLKVTENIKKFKPGDILVTSMTRPEFLPLMSKAGAFITEEGGISCHAAIVAREMKKPCIIGVKGATKFLKDGDIVQVDAKNGLITKK